MDIEISVKYLKKNSSGEENYKYFIGYLDDDYRIKPLNIMLPKTTIYVQGYDGKTKWMYFLIEDELLKKKNDIREKVSKSIKREIDSEPANNKNFLKTRIKCNGD